jgi:LacI family transcriptional regulator
MANLGGELSGPATVPTIAMIAKTLGVSRSTVSRAFTRPNLLRPETVQRVLKAAESLGYAPNQAARALSTGHSGVLALIVPDIANPFFPPLIRAAQGAADQRDFCVLLGDSAENPAQETRLISRFSPQVDGIVLASSRLANADLAAQVRRQPLVLINRDIAQVPRVLVDSRTGVMQAVAHLGELGHSRIAYVGGPVSSWSDHQRRRAVTAASTEHGMRLTMLHAKPATYPGGASTVEGLLDNGCTAVLAFDDVVAHGIMAGLAERGARVPDDVSVIGEIAVSVLLELVGGRKLGDVRYSLESHLVVRATTGPARE